MQLIHDKMEMYFVDYLNIKKKEKKTDLPPECLSK